MPDALSWDSPGLTWSPAYSWDSTPAVTPKPKKMNTKAIIDFSDYSAADLGNTAQIIHDHFVEHATVFDDPPITMTGFQTMITDYKAKLLARASKATTDIIAFNDARQLLEATLTDLGNYVNTVAKGSAAVVDQSGFPSYNTGSAPNLAPPLAPENLRLRHGVLSGSLIIRYTPDRNPSVNEVQINLQSTPDDEASWITKGMFQRGTAELSGLPPGVIVWVRVRTVGLKGVMGAWSDPAQIRTL